MWQLLKLVWHRLTAHPEEIVWAGVFALVIWLIVDPWGSDSRIRALIRHVKNKMSERSAARLRTRIMELQKAREVIALYLASDKALYLAQFRMLILMLMILAVGGALGILGQMLTTPDFRITALLVYAIGIAVGFAAVKFSSLDTKEKITDLLAQRDREIANLQRKLDTMTA